MSIRQFEDIEAWQAARRLAQAVYVACGEGNFAKDWALRDQMNRASGSAMDNIAEGFDGGSNAEFVRFLVYAQRSCSEVQSQLYRALDREYVTQDGFNALYEHASVTKAKIGGLIRYLKSCKK